MEASLPSSFWRGKGTLGPVSHLLDWKRGHFRGLAHWNLASALVSTCSAYVWLSPTPPVSIGAGVLGWEGPATGASDMGGSSAGVSDRLSLPGSEVVEEAFPHPSPLSFPEGGLYGVFVVDLEHMLKVPSPPTAAVFCSHLHWTGASGPGTTARLGLGVSLGSS